jgi:CheY-like chemotaxis protein/AraC-like DNA-binding protein
MLTSEQFLKHLRDALNHLYDPDRLRRSPLVALFDVADRFDTPAALQRILTEAIESLKPKADEPPRSHGRRVYDLLLYRYVQQFSQQEVANQLGMSVRHLRREQRVALEALAYRLWEQFDLETRLRETADTEAAVQAVATSPGADLVAEEELAWLKDAPPERLTDLNQTLPAVLDLAHPLAVQHGVGLETALAGALPELAVHPVALRQALLNLLSVAIPRAGGGEIHILARPLRWEVEIEVRCARIPVAPRSALGDEEASLDMAHRLTSLCGGRLNLVTDEDVFGATLVLPALEQLPVLVIDDNADTLQLLQRYAAGTRYRLIGTRDPEQALDLAEELSPQIIVLDVMMPQMDGWEVLGRLRQHPLTCQTPIVVCTILAQEELALSLGASAFVRKPVTRQDFLAALDRQVALMGSLTGIEPR